MSRYPSIPDFADTDGMMVAVRAIKEIVEQMAGQRTGESKGAPSVFVQDAAPSALLNPTNKLGDLWIKTSTPPVLHCWTARGWTEV